MATTKLTDAQRVILAAAAARESGPVHERLRHILRKVIIGPNRIQLVFSVAGMRTVLDIATPSGIWPTNEPDDSEFAAVVPFVTTRRGRQMKVVLPGAGNGNGGTPNPSLVTGRSASRSAIACDDRSPRSCILGLPLGFPDWPS